MSIGSEISDLLSRADAGDPDAQRELSIRLQNGDGIAADPDRASSWLRIAAENGDAWSQTEHAIFLRSTKLPSNEKESIKWLNLAASQGDARARYTLAGQYFLGIGIGVDIESAVTNLVMASMTGSDEARNMVHKMRPTLSPSMWESISSRIDWAQITFVMGRSTSGSGPGGDQTYETDDEWSAEPSEWLRQEQNVANGIFLSVGSPSILNGAFGTEVTVKQVFVGRAIVSEEKVFATTISLRDIIQADSMPVWWKPSMEALKDVATALRVIEERKWIRSSYQSH